MKSAKKFRFVDINKSPVVLSLLGTVSALSIVAGAVWGLGDRPPWAGVDRVAQIESNYDRTRLNIVENQIIQLERDRQRRRLSQFEEDVLRSLHDERRILRCKLRLERC